MNDQIISFLTTSGALVIGWMLNEIGGFFKVNRENKKVLYQILYKQLEIRNVIMRTNITAIQSDIETVLLMEMPSDNNKDIREIIGEVFKGFIQNELNNRFSNSIKSLIGEYKSYITALSQIDPFTTYAISDKDVALDYLGYINEYLKGIEFYLDKPSLSNEGPGEKDSSLRDFNEVFAAIRENITPVIWKSAMETIELDILLISRKLGFITRFKTKSFLKRTGKLELNRESMKKIETYIQSFGRSNTES